MKEKFKSIGGLILILIFAAFAKVIVKDYLLQKRNSSNKYNFQSQKSPKKLLETVINLLNKKIELPMKIDEFTTLVRVYQVGDDVLAYEYEIDANEIDIVKMKPILYQRMKSNIGKIAKENNFVISYVFKSLNSGKVIAVIRFEPDENND
jgi:peptidoglycan hydrolase CwlO-like protein